MTPSGAAPGWLTVTTRPTGAPPMRCLSICSSSTGSRAPSVTTRGSVPANPRSGPLTAAMRLSGALYTPTASVEMSNLADRPNVGWSHTTSGTKRRYALHLRLPVVSATRSRNCEDREPWGDRRELVLRGVLADALEELADLPPP